jgi:PhzF family phenazine biosynthesis protein
MTIQVLHYDAFTSTPGTGNPAGVVLDGDLSTQVMQEVARRIAFNETAFVVSVQPDAVQVRYFTPGHEVDLCGHATIATFAALREWRRLRPETSKCMLISKAGSLEIQYRQPPSGESLIWMAQPAAKFVAFARDSASVARALGLDQTDLDPELPLVYGSTGLWTLIVPVRGLDAMRRMKPANADFPSVLGQMPRASIHPICLETVDPRCKLHGRHFSSPYSGTREDPVTGTASGVMGAYYAMYINPAPTARHALVIEQGHEINRRGHVHVEVQSAAEEYRVRVGGSAVFVKQIDLAIELAR